MWFTLVVKIQSDANKSEKAKNTSFSYFERQNTAADKTAIKAIA